MTKAEIDSPIANVLKLLGYSAQQIDALNEYICGTMTIEGAPHVKEGISRFLTVLASAGKKVCAVFLLNVISK